MNYNIKLLQPCPNTITNGCYIIPYIKNSNNKILLDLDITEPNKDFDIIVNQNESKTYYIYNIDPKNLYNSIKKNLTGIYKSLESNKYVINIYHIIHPSSEDIQAVLLKQITFRYNQFLTEVKNKDVYPCYIDNINETLFKLGIMLGKIHSFCRYLQCTPSNIKTPEWLANKIVKTIESNKLPIKHTIHDLDWIKAQGMGGIIAVSNGSTNKPYFLVLEYNKNLETNNNYTDYICLVGKGITFDSGGINLKHKSNLMHMDMSGLSTCVGIIMGCAFLNLDKKILCVLPICENMPSSSASKPNDIIKHFGGITAEIDNTDAEGRLILADAVSYVNSLKPKMICDFSTLTGSASNFTGSYASVLISNNETLINSYTKCANYYSEKVISLPIWDELNEFLKSEVADIKNSGYKAGGDTMMAMLYIYKFVSNKEIKYMHFDLADTIESENFVHINGNGKSSVILPFIKFLGII